MTYKEYKEAIENASCDDYAFEYLKEAEYDSAITPKQFEQLEKIFNREWSPDPNDEDYQRVLFCNGDDTDD